MDSGDLNVAIIRNCCLVLNYLSIKDKNFGADVPQSLIRDN